MTRLDILNKINNYFIDDSVDAKQNLVDLMNNLVIENKYKEHLDLFFVMISLTQLYGFLTYLNVDEKNYFFLSDYFRSNSYSALNLDYLNSGQLSLLNEISTHNKSFISAPTSFGKTSIVNEYVVNNIEKFNNIIFVVPTNSLLEELYIKYTKYLSNCKNVNISTQPIEIFGKKNILFLTPERFLIYYEETSVKNIDLVIMDETYKIMDYKNKSISDFVNHRSVRFRKVADIIAGMESKTIYLSPFTYELSDSMDRFFKKHEIKKIDRKIEYVTHELILIDHPKKFKHVFPNSSINYKKDDRISIKVSKIIQNLDHEKNLIYVKGYSEAYRIIEEYPKTIIIEDDRFLKFVQHLYDNFTIDSKTKWQVISGLEKGIGIYISPIPRYIKREIIKLFEDDFLHTLVVTTSFTEGVNTNAKNLIFTSLINGPNSNKLSSIDVLNVAGRAGRFGKNSVGKIYCISSDTYSRIMDLQKEGIIKLENYNYFLEDNNVPKGNLLDYEIDMMDEQYLTEEEKNDKNKLYELLDFYRLNSKDLKISLNVSNRWKIYLYDWFIKDKSKNDNYYNAIINLIDDVKKTESIEIIFKALKACFMENSINAFPTEVYDISAFDKSGEFTWGRLYKLYSSGTIIDVIRKNKSYIRNKYNLLVKGLNTKNRDTIEAIFKDAGSSWILRKYYESDNVTENSQAFYTEAFRFMSNIVQYKIPYYVSFFSSIFKLYIKKNNTKYDGSKIEIHKIAMSLEDGILDDENYRSLVDFGLSNDLITKIRENNITVEDIRNGNYSKSYFDEYEVLLLEDFVLLMK